MSDGDSGTLGSLTFNEDFFLKESHPGTQMFAPLISQFDLSSNGSSWALARAKARARFFLGTTCFYSPALLQLFLNTQEKSPAPKAFVQFEDQSEEPLEAIRLQVDSYGALCVSFSLIRFAKQIEEQKILMKDALLILEFPFPDDFVPEGNYNQEGEGILRFGTPAALTITGPPPSTNVNNSLKPSVHPKADSNSKSAFRGCGLNLNSREPLSLFIFAIILCLCLFFLRRKEAHER
mgnify:CR=1 FL=1